MVIIKDRATGQSVTYRRGDVVRLNSGGPPMTIVSFETDGETPRPMAVCHWVTSAANAIGVVESRIGVRAFDVRCLTKETSCVARAVAESGR